MRRHVLWAVTACFPVFPSITQAAELDILSPPDIPIEYEVQAPDPARACSFRLTGPLATGDGDRVVAHLQQTPRGVPTPVLCLDSPGGSLVEALELARFLRSAKIGTRLEPGTRCESACALVFMAGSFIPHESGPRKWRVMHPTARLGFHSPSLNVPEGNYRADTVKASYELAMRSLAMTLIQLVQNRDFDDGEHLKTSLMAAMLQTPSDRMYHIQTVDQAGRWGITVGPLTGQDTTFDAPALRRACANKVAWEADKSALEAAHYDRWHVAFGKDQYGPKVDVIYDEFWGDACTWDVPESAAATGWIALPDLGQGLLDLSKLVDPSTRLVDLPH